MWRLRFDYFHQFTVGETPFFFDEVELRKEFRPAIEYRSRGFEFAYVARIDASDGNVFDHRFEIRHFAVARPNRIIVVRALD